MRRSNAAAAGPRSEQPYQKDPKVVELERLISQSAQLQPLRLGSDSHELDVNEAELDRLMGIPEIPETDPSFEAYMARVQSVITVRQKKLFPAIDRVLNKYSEIVFMGVAPLGYINPNADDNNCTNVYPVCLDVTRRDLLSVSYLGALRSEYNKSNINSIPFIGPLLANIKLATRVASFVLSILSYRYTLIWLNNRLAALGAPVLVEFLRDFYAFCENPEASQFEVFKQTHPVVFAVLSKVTDGALSMQTFIVLTHQFISRQNRLAAAAARGGAAAAAGGIPGWNVPINLGPLEFLRGVVEPAVGVVQATVATTLKMFRPQICWAGFDAAPYVQGGITYVDQGLSAILIRSSLAIEMTSPECNNLFVSAFLKMKYSKTFSMLDGSIDKSEFKIVFIQERNKYVSEIMNALTQRGLTYVEAKQILKDVYPQAFEFAIESTDFQDDGMSVRSNHSSVWTVRGSTASSMWRADQHVQGQQLEESTVFNWFLRTATHLLTTCSEALMYGTMGVATLPGAYEPPIFGSRPTAAQRRALSCATHAVTVFDEWINSLNTVQLQAARVGVNEASFRNSLERIKTFYRLKCETKILPNGDIVYVMDAGNITGLKDTIRSLTEEDSKCLSAILEYSKEEEAMNNMQHISEEAAARAIAGAAAAAPLPPVGAAVVSQPLPGGAAGAAAVSQPLPAEVVDEVNESSQIALANIIPPAQILEAIVQEEAPGPDSLEERYQVEQDISRELDNVDQGGVAADVNQDAGPDQGAAAVGQGNGRQGAGRSRKRSASKRTRRKAKQSSKKLKRKSRRYVRHRRSTRRKN